MLALAAFIPDTALLVPGAAGRAVVLAELRAAALAAGAELVAVAPDRVVVVAPGPIDRVLETPARASLAPAGIDDAASGWVQPDVVTVPDVALGVGASVAQLVLAQVGWRGPVTVVEVAPGGNADRAQVLRRRGHDLAAGDDRVGLLVAGSLSARHGPEAPQATDPRAARVDEEMLVDLLRADAAAQDRLTAIGGDLAAELALTAWAPVQIMLGAVAGLPVDAALTGSSAPFGVPYAVVVWRPVGSQR